ncbi:RelA/SpoT family protein [Pedomonas mirosovicensis]|uniref:RelA/SpoT family protein n=1 Tax=Pedomonas mirosovicensis TaxID=2908641 RepID=UPI00216A50AE|nr:bifunctional (p)ppGpp synthetase/guanosine-3',5'-bis(diphosphate) 3'-pyrophosphohydrolase [Pedomonas mirosovicensis]MCH8685539.1 bifunctional (p)ppGpp synthetase/guanosine-3',5'-bis(diphosphate) 3'-pyrophosphohydrolase [Pedomonas mirosovicensis]
MLRQYELVEKVKSYDPAADEDMLNRAYVFSMKAHGSQLRASGDPYFSHPIEVAGILTDLKLDCETITTAILHDTIEDTVATYEQIEQLFGHDVARLVDGVTKLSRIEAQTESERAAENFRKFLLAMSDDIRVLLVKLADRLHNMRTLHFIKKEEKRRRIARETLEIYAPLAERIGMYEFKDELTEIAFRELEPQAYESITKRLEQLRETAGDLVPRVIEDIEHLLHQHGLNAEVLGREKRPHSIWKKMQERDISFEQLSDIVAFRVIVDTVPEVYRALGILHGRWPTVPGRFKDYISTPKRNGYRSVHTTVMGPGRMRIEIQIRTRDMHAQAELGLAAHWAYKAHIRAEGGQQSPWLQDLLEILEHASSPEEFLEHTKMAMYQDQVFCFTPKGELIQLPKGSTPVDFAYAVHSRLGETAVGAKVNGRVVPLRTVLQNGDQVEILRSTAQQPDPAWETFVITGKARSAIRRYVRQKEREDGIALGRRLLDALIERIKVPLAEGAIPDALERLKLPDEEALYLALARHQVSDEAVMEAILPGSAGGSPRRRKTPEPEPGNAPLALSIQGLTPGAVVHLAECCHPIPGDRIVGIREPGQGVVVHAIDCKALEAFTNQPEVWIDLRWHSEADRIERFVARLAVVMRNEPGALATVATILGQSDANIANLRLTHRDRQFFTFELDVEVTDLRHLTRVNAALRAAQVVSSVERMRL